MLLRYWKLIIVFAVFIIIPLSGVIAYRMNSDLRSWWNLPLENRLLSIELEIERPFNHWFESDIDEVIANEITVDLLRNSMSLGASWIVNMQEASGRFNYWYHPPTNSLSNKNDDNFLRQAGTCYSLVSAFKVSGDSIFLKSAKKNLDYLLEFKKEKGPDTTYFLFDKKAKLGGIALPMLAMLELRKITGDTTNDHHLKSMANMILYLQKIYDTGQFKSTYVYRGIYNYESLRKWESEIYPGEAMLALAEMYAIFQDGKYLKSIDWAYEFYSKDDNWKPHPFIPWSVSAFVRLYLETGTDKYSEFVFRMIDRILYFQNLDPDDEVYGSLFSFPTVFTATYMEALGDAILLAKHLNDKKRLNEYSMKAKIGYRWLIKLQYSPEEVNSNGYERIAIGGFRTSFIGPEVRIDNTQHAISALSKGIKYVY
ncbi:MAG: hypothetical protein O2887_16065 [Bacteroidetes bacterium]|nr:hypothetical protein [Bacteroidota bacterium]MDA1121978.1 hypothetical protein [Bacteroidota bacterium]